MGYSLFYWNVIINFHCWAKKKSVLMMLSDDYWAGNVCMYLFILESLQNLLYQDRQLVHHSLILLLEVAFASHSLKTKFCNPLQPLHCYPLMYSLHHRNRWKVKKDYLHLHCSLKWTCQNGSNSFSTQKSNCSRIYFLIYNFHI